MQFNLPFRNNFTHTTPLRSALLQFFNIEKHRHVLVYYTISTLGTRMLYASPRPPDSLQEKFMVFMKLSNATKITRDNIHTQVCMPRPPFCLNPICLNPFCLNPSPLDPLILIPLIRPPSQLKP